LWATMTKNIDMVKLLVNNGASILKPKKDGLTILHVAATINDVRILDYAIKNKQTRAIDIQNKDVKSSSLLF
jgi:ankyrin repeat protein